MDFSMREFIQLRDFIYQRTGLFFEEKKLFFLKKRLKERVLATDSSGATDYLRMLKFSDTSGAEFQAFTNLITTNETYFFREFEQLACFAENCLPEFKASKPGVGLKNLNIWCAACSSGEEAYTLAIILKSMLLEEEEGWRCRVLGTDIDYNVLEQCEKGVYSKRSIKDVPPDYLESYFSPVSSNYSVNSSIRELVHFRHLNFMDRNSMRKMRGYDFVFCRNALIYFDEKSRKEVVNHIYNALNPGGFVYLGHSESIGRITNKFKLRWFGKHTAYQKPL